MIIEHNEEQSQGTISTNLKTKTSKDMKYMTKLQLRHHLKKTYETAPIYLKARLKNIDVDSLILGRKDNSKKEPTKDEIVAYIETLTEGLDGLPINVSKYLEKAKHTELKKLAKDTNLIHVPTTTKKEELIEILKETYKSRPYLVLGKPEFEVLAVRVEKRKTDQRMIFNIPLEGNGGNPKIEEKISEKKPKIKTVEQVKKKNLLKYQVVVLKFVDGLSELEISNRTSASRAIVKKWVKKFEEFGDINYTVYKPGRPKIIDEPIKEMIKFEHKYQPAMDTKDLIPKIKEEFNKNVSNSTLLRCLNKMGKFVVPKSKGALNDDCKKKRHYYCVKMSTRSFKNIIFTDESMIELKRNKRKIFRLSGNQAIKRYTPGKLKVMVWGAISMKGKICLRILPLKTKINSEYYCREILSALMDTVGEHHKRWTFMQDNAPCHVSVETLEFIKNNNIRLIPFKHPANSPDLNPIELIWNIMKKKVEKMMPRGLHELRNSIRKAWDDIDPESIKKCIKSLRKVMKLVIDAKGDNVFIRKPKRGPKVNYCEEVLPDEKKSDNQEDLKFYPNCEDKSSQRKKLKTLKNLKNKIRELNLDCIPEMLTENEKLEFNNKINVIVDKGRKIAGELKSKSSREYEYFLGNKHER